MLYHNAQCVLARVAFLKLKNGVLFEFNTLYSLFICYPQEKHREKSAEIFLSLEFANSVMLNILDFCGKAVTLTKFQQSPYMS